MLLLTIESTCDETAAAVIDDRLQVRGAVVASQERLHRRSAGSCPRLPRGPSRADHARHRRDVTQAGVTLAEIDAVGVATTPGLAGSLLVGLAAAKALCIALGSSAGGDQSPAAPTSMLAAWLPAATCFRASA